ncbi:MAG: hypothetical protein AAF493_15465 [Pseudomonadota bacterium]
MRALPTVTAILALSLGPIGLAAAQQGGNHGCTEPTIPASFASVEEYNVLVDKTLTFRKCIDTYVQQQRDLSKRHAEQGTQAAEAWNQFAGKMAKVKPPSE